MVLGGGGSSNPLTEILLESLLALLLLVEAGRRLTTGHGAPRIPGAAWTLALLAIVVPVIQLVPLPTGLWHALPGRQVEIAALRLVGASDRWMPLTLVPSRTFTALLAMVSCVVVLLLAARLAPDHRRWLLATITAVSFVSVLLGTLQLASGSGGGWSIYSEHHTGYLIGFQGNRNAEVDVLQIGMLALVSFAVSAGGGQLGRDRGLALILAPLIALLCLAVVMTGSRGGILLLPVTLIFALIIAWPRLGALLAGASRHIIAILVLAGTMAAAMVAFMAMRVGALERVATRFTADGDGRKDLWIDTWYAIKQVWPAGGGIGSFQPMLFAAERLEVVDPSLPVRAHNDWLEWLLEAGVPGIVVMLAIAAALIAVTLRSVAAMRGRPDRPVRRAQVCFGLGSLLILALHAFVDYPMRSMALASLCAVAVAMLMPPATSDRVR